jgi:hypothetical protein
LFSYVYDYGANWSWMHCFPLIIASTGARVEALPRTLAVCGATTSFSPALDDPKHDRHEGAVEGLGEDIDATSLDQDAVATALAALVNRQARSRKKLAPSIQD